MNRPRLSSSKPLVLMSLVASVCLFFPIPKTPQEPCGATSFVISTAQKLLRALYPDVSDKNYIMSVSTFRTFDSDWTHLSFIEVEVGPAEKGHMDLVGGRNGHPAQMVERKAVLGASFEFDTEGLLTGFRVRSDTVTYSSKNDHMRAIVDANPGWSDQQVATAMEEAGARFGPSQHDAVVTAVPVKLLEPFIGVLQIDSAEFRLRHPQPPHAIAELYWVVLGHSQVGGGRIVQWGLGIEPFQGRLVSLSRSE